ncbi:LysR family transcriptional regulator [Marinivivus vitaminiproducens]|uniref:LysR family transcriptional regulator n=1 Tax=Marinivivus vitaminiproducens TaxID=3035935 RepID=UPI0027A6D372|nr:LysR substrate-binding domain-containing protein [Geminicoccaceae bacterium SCSIO 64248]
MELIWLEDFAALADSLNFSRAADARNVTQPAFSRRIRALEAWLGAPLFERTAQGVHFTAAGERFRGEAQDLVRRIHDLRRDVREHATREAESLRFAATHALSFTFFPTWLRTLEQGRPLGRVQLISDSLAGCEQVMAQGLAQFLLCHGHDLAPLRLDDAFVRRPVGNDDLIPMAAPDPSGQARWRLPGRAASPLPYLAYSEESGLGRIVEARHRLAGRPCALRPAITSHLAAVLLTLARDGVGIAWLPRSLAEPDLQAGRLVRAGAPEYDIAVEIQVVRPRARQNAMAEALWARIETTDCDAEERTRAAH